MILRKFLIVFFCVVPFSCFSSAFKNESSIQEVLTYWFGDLQTADDYPQKQSKLWFGGGAVVDQEIRDRFEHLVKAAINHELDDWKQSPRGRLGLIILIDQFSRNIYRGTPKAFAGDLLAQELALEGLFLQEDQKLFPIERVFFYLPFEHSEDLKIQKLSVSVFQELSISAPASMASIFKSFVDYAFRHYEIIKRFGRFPHRNFIMGRESTLEEWEFLKDPHSSF